MQLPASHIGSSLYMLAAGSPHLRLYRSTVMAGNCCRYRGLTTLAVRSRARIFDPDAPIKNGLLSVLQSRRTSLHRTICNVSCRSKQVQPATFFIPSAESRTLETI